MCRFLTCIIATHADIVSSVGLRRCTARCAGGIRSANADMSSVKEIGRVIGAVQKLTHRHHTLRESIEDASLQPFSGLVMAALVLYGSFSVVRFIVTGKQVNIPVPMCSATWGRRRLARSGMYRDWETDRKSVV